jgi:hypothetical protein
MRTPRKIKQYQPHVTHKLTCIMGDPNPQSKQFCGMLVQHTFSHDAWPIKVKLYYNNTVPDKPNFLLVQGV